MSGPPARSFALQDAARSYNDTDAVASGGDAARRLPIIGEDSLWPLCKRFLALIHVKNPVLDVPRFKQYVRAASEYGPSWDGPGCLVLLACALACVSRPYDENQIGGPGEDFSAQSPVSVSLDRNSAEVYYSAAKRRLGLLPDSLISIQCQYFAGLYEKFTIRPLAAWRLMQQACVQFQAYLYSIALSSPGAEEGGQPRSRHTEQRLYWSCVKAECELRAELQLPASGLLKFKYPDLFPSLSLPVPSSDEAAESAQCFIGSIGHSPVSHTGSSTGSVSNSRLEPEEERSWLLYLAEISLRKIMNRILEHVYSMGEQYWATNIGRVLFQHQVLYDELCMWRSHLPEQLQFPDHDMPANELAFLLQTRYLCSLQWIYMPFLYYISIRATDSDLYLPKVAPLAQACVDSSANLIPIIARHHRHGGVWGLLRKSFSCAITLVVARKVEMLGLLTLPANWEELVQLSTETIQKWGAEATVGGLMQMVDTLAFVSRESVNQQAVSL
ncbi:hypothetical protein GQ53DRAFT_754622 [Thozetella sp. PMI_491]|nr:hypothetical protein GQ53DRAFT_754622 [Thozetella sp. PMI_491]